MTVLHPDEGDLRRLRGIAEVFRPSGPIDRQDLFSGRVLELLAVQDVIFQTGRHGLIYGERGVGKTSLAAVSIELCEPAWIAMRINCDVADTFGSMWQKVIDELATLRAIRDDRDLGELTEKAAEILQFDTIGPTEVRQALAVLSTIAPVLIFFDEFDRVHDPMTRTLLADLVKTLSDQLVNATVVLVGVADDVESLLAEHASVSRALAQIRMPRMTTEEIRAVIEGGLGKVGMSAEQRVMTFLVHLPQGLPHYAHLLAQDAARSAAMSGRTLITAEDLKFALSAAIDSADESMTRSFVDATASSHATLYERVLLACALAPVDDMGYFSPGDLRGPLLNITGEDYDVRDSLVI